MSTLKNDLAYQLITFYSAQEKETDFEGRVANTDRMADHIIALFREAMLSDDAVKTFARETGYDYEGSIVDGITAALEAITGEQP